MLYYNYTTIPSPMQAFVYFFDITDSLTTENNYDIMYTVNNSSHCKTERGPNEIKTSSNGQGDLSFISPACRNHRYLPINRTA